MSIEGFILQTHLYNLLFNISLYLQKEEVLFEQSRCISHDIEMYISTATRCTSQPLEY